MPRSINIGGTVPQRIYQGRNLDAFAKSLDKIDERAKQALAQRTQIAVALGQLNLNSADEQFRADYIRDIQQQLDEAAIGGDYSQTLQQATLLAGKVASDPAIIGRVKANAAYEEFKKSIQNRNDITQDIKDYALAHNPYHYEDKYDEQGHLIGGSTWEPSKTPVSTVDLSNLMTKAKQWVAVHKGGGVNDIKFVDADGNLTSDPSKNVYGLAYKKSGTWEYVSEKDLNDALKSAIDTTPGARASLQQDYDVALWKYNKMTPEEKKKNIDSDITENGLLLSPEEYLTKRVKPGIHAMSYYNSGSDIEVGSGQTAYRQDVAARQAAAQQAAALNMNLDATNEGAAIDVDVPDIIGTTKAGLDGTLDELRRLFPKLSKSNAFQRGINQGRYNELANLCRHSMTSKDPVVQHQARQAITALRTYGNQYNHYVAGLGKSEQDAVAFDAARRAGSRLPGNNKFTREYNQQINRLFNNGKIRELGYKCYDDEQFNAISQAMDCHSESDWRRKGFRITAINGQKTITFDKNNTWLSKLSDSVDSSMGFWKGIGSSFSNAFTGGGAGIVDMSNGSQVRNANYTFKNLGTINVAGIDILNPKSNSPAQAAAWRANTINQSRGFGKVPVNSKMYSSTLDRNALFDKYTSGQIDEKTYNIGLKKIENDEDNLTNPSLLMNAALYVDGKRIPEDEKAAYIEAISQAKQEKVLNVTVGRNHGLAQTVTEFNIGKAKNSTPQTITMVGANGSSVLQSYERNTSTLARDEATQLNISGSSKSLGNGGTISNVTNSNALYTNSRGKRTVITRSQAENILRRELNRQQIADALYTGEGDNVVVTAIAKSLTEAGEPVNDITVAQEYKFIKDNY
nr:MAG TPA: hypothetical protein [Crassvirales sp.]